MTRFLAIGLLIMAAPPLGCSSNADAVEGSIPELVDYLKDGDEPTRALADALRDEYELVRQRAAEALAAIGPEAKPAVSGLVVALRDGVPQVREAVKAALRSIDPVGAARHGA